MKQKLGLACTLVRSPELLLLDEPTVGVDPLSRRELWEIVTRLVAEQGLTVLLSTAYLDEAERCNRVIMLHRAKCCRRARLSRWPPWPLGAASWPPRSRGKQRAACRRNCWIGRTSSMRVPDGGRVRFVRSRCRLRLPSDLQHVIRWRRASRMGS